MKPEGTLPSTPTSCPPDHLREACPRPSGGPRAHLRRASIITVCSFRCFPGDPTIEKASRRFIETDPPAEVDLTIFEPVVLPVHILDNAGTPVKTIRASLHVTFPDGRKMTHNAPVSLDDAGKTRFLLYHPAAESWYEFDEAPDMPGTKPLGTPGFLGPCSGRR